MVAPRRLGERNLCFAERPVGSPPTVPYVFFRAVWRLTAAPRRPSCGAPRPPPPQQLRLLLFPLPTSFLKFMTPRSAFRRAPPCLTPLPPLFPQPPSSCRFLFTHSRRFTSRIMPDPSRIRTPDSFPGSNLLRSQAISLTDFFRYQTKLLLLSVLSVRAPPPGHAHDPCTSSLRMVPVDSLPSPRPERF